MKKRTVKAKINKLVRHYGNGGINCHARARGREELGRVLGIDQSYVWRLQKGQRKPGIHLWQAVERLYDEVIGDGKG